MDLMNGSPCETPQGKKPKPLRCTFLHMHPIFSAFQAPTMADFDLSCVFTAGVIDVRPDDGAAASAIGCDSQ